MVEETPKKDKKNKEREKCSANLAHRAVYQEKMTDKKNQPIGELEYCEQNSYRGNKALKTGLFPSVKSLLTVNRIIDGTSNHPLHAKEYCNGTLYC